MGKILKAGQDLEKQISEYIISCVNHQKQSDKCMRRNNKVKLKFQLNVKVEGIFIVVNFEFSFVSW